MKADLQDDLHFTLQYKNMTKNKEIYPALKQISVTHHFQLGPKTCSAQQNLKKE